MDMDLVVDDPMQEDIHNHDGADSSLFQQFLTEEYSGMSDYNGHSSPSGSSNPESPHQSWSTPPSTPPVDSYQEDAEVQEQASFSPHLSALHQHIASLDPQQLVNAIFENAPSLSADQIDSIASTMAHEVKMEPVYEIPTGDSAVPLFDDDDVVKPEEDSDDDDAMDEDDAPKRKKAPRKKVTAKKGGSASRTPSKKRKVTTLSPKAAEAMYDFDDDDDSSASTSAEVELPEDVSRLSRDQLLQLSSKSFEEYARRLQAKKDLNSEEKKELKRQRRLIKNRESAQASRQRKKSYIEKLEAKVASLTTTNAQLREQMVAIQSDNGSLRQEVVHLQGLLKQTPGLSQLFTSGINYVANLAKQDAKEASSSHPSGGNHPNNGVRAAGVCLLVLLFSFGLFFPNTVNVGTTPKLPFDTAREPVPEVLPASHRIFSNSKAASAEFRGASSGRSLMSVINENPTEANLNRIQDAFQQRVAAPKAVVVSSEQATAANVSQASSDKMDVDDANVIVSELPRCGSADGIEKSVPPAVVSSNSAVRDSGIIITSGEDKLNATLMARIAESISDWKVDSTYFVASSIQQLQPPQEVYQRAAAASAGSADAKASASAQNTVTFIIPPTRGANGNSHINMSSHDSSNEKLLEVSCQVVSVNWLPFKELPQGARQATGFAQPTSTVEAPA